MTKIKYIKRQDCGLKTTPGNSGDSGINLSKDVLEYIHYADIEKGSECDITFHIQKDDFIEAVQFISEQEKLYKTDSKSFKTIDITELCKELTQCIEDYFCNSDTLPYTCKLKIKQDGRIYLLGMKNGNFPLRDFLVEERSALQIENSDNKIIIRILSNVTDNQNHISKNMSNTEKKLLISDTNITGFAYKCITYFYENGNWSNIINYINRPEDIKEGDSIKVSSQNFSLTGMFKCTTEEELNRTYNTPRRRWYSEPFILDGKTVFFSTEWYPGPREDGRPYGLMIPEFGKFISECFGNEYIYVKNGANMELWEEVESLPGVSSFSIDSIISLIETTGLQYDSTLIKRFAFALMTKPFVILSGLAGSGKTQLALTFAKALIEDKSQMCVVSVGADWTNREPLLGFPNALDSTKYQVPESGVLQLLIEANKEINKNRPYFLILDEMNMSYVERYFADFLSVMESDEYIKLWDGVSGHSVPDKIQLPKNVYIIGTINVDETTYMFSPKVLDRANVIEFKISTEEMESYLGNITKVDIKSILNKGAGMAESFVHRSLLAKINPDDKIKQTLVDFFKQLKSVNAEFGYRSANEIYRYIDIARTNDDTESKLTDSMILDSAIVQKLLPKLHGSRKKLVPVLKTLWSLCGTNCTLDSADIVPNGTTYPLTADKVLRMYHCAIDNGFTSFSEA